MLNFPPGLFAQQDKVAAFKQSLEANAKQQKQYKWVETTVISMKGEEKSRVQKQCFYGPDGKIQKQQLTAPPEPAEAPGGMKGKIAAKKKAEITEAMKQAAALVQSYVPPDPQRIQATKAAGNLAVVPTGPDSIRLDLRSYAKSGDTLSLGLDTARNAIQTVSVKSYLESEKEPVTLEVTFARLREGLSYPGQRRAQRAGAEDPGGGPELQLRASDTGGDDGGQAGAAVAPASTGAASTTAIDTLTAPIALYPDALIAQILAASTDFAALQKVSDWMGQNASLKGSELQDAAAKAGFAPCYIALAPFPQVVKMMVEKPDWTKELGKAYATDQKAVLDSIQRLRAQAQALGNLEDHAAAGSRDGDDVHRGAGHLGLPHEPPGDLRPRLPHGDRLRAAGPPSIQLILILGRGRGGAGRLHRGDHHRVGVQRLLLRAVRIPRRVLPGVRRGVGPPGGLLRGSAGLLRGSAGLRGGSPRERSGVPGRAAGAAPINVAGESGAAPVSSAGESGAAPVHGAVESGDPSDERSHERNRAGQPGIAAVHGAVESGEPSVHGPGESDEPSEHRLLERRKRAGRECQGGFEPRRAWWRRRVAGRPPR